jgi:two-component sensor histidine kinase
VLIILLHGKELGVSANYFIFLPFLTIAISFGLYGGIFIGILALPANLLLFKIIGHPEFSPESKIIAQIFAILVGVTLGYISDFFNKMMTEIKNRMLSEKALEQSLREKEILLKEINHRVKNNLNLIKSIIQLQSNRIGSKSQKNELQKLSQRVISIALVQDLLFAQDSLDALDLRIYLKKLIETLFEEYNHMKVPYNLMLCENPIIIDSKKITSIGLIMNEVITNSMKYAFTGTDKPHMEIELRTIGESLIMRIRDNGGGYPDDFTGQGLGLKLINSLTSHLKGDVRFEKDKGALVTLTIPLTD